MKMDDCENFLPLYKMKHQWSVFIDAAHLQTYRLQVADRWIHSWWSRIQTHTRSTCTGRLMLSTEQHLTWHLLFTSCFFFSPKKELLWMFGLLDAIGENSESRESWDHVDPHVEEERTRPEYKVQTQKRKINPTNGKSPKQSSQNHKNEANRVLAKIGTREVKQRRTKRQVRHCRWVEWTVEVDWVQVNDETDCDRAKYRPSDGDQWFFIP